MADTGEASYSEKEDFSRKTSLEDELANLKDVNTKSEAAKAVSAKILNQIRVRLQRGESFGDRIKDFAIVWNNTLNENAQEPYRKLEEKIKGKEGEQILAVKQHETIMGCPGIIPPREISPEFIGIQSSYYLGVLTGGLELDIEDGRIIFPTEKHVSKSDYRSKWDLTQKPIIFHAFDCQNIGSEIPYRTEALPNDLSSQFERSLRIYTGKDVEEYFTKGFELDMTYGYALNMLGLPIPQSIAGAYNAKRIKNSTDLITKIEELEAQKDPAHQNENIIRSLLKGALINEMHQWDLEITPKPGMKISVPEYIRGMCTKYELKTDLK